MRDFDYIASPAKLLTPQNCSDGWQQFPRTQSANRNYFSKPMKELKALLEVV